MHEIFDRSRGEQAAMHIQPVDAYILRPADNLPLAQLLDHLAVAPTAHIGEARDAADGLLALLGRAAEKQVGDAFLADDMGYIVAVDHDGRQIELQLLGEFEAVELVDEYRSHFFPEGLDELDHELAPAHQLWMAADGLTASLQPGLAGMTAAMRVRTHVGRPTKAGDAICRDCRAVSVEVDLQRGPDEQIRRIETGKLAVQAVGT